MERHRDLSDVQKNSTHLRLPNQTRRVVKDKALWGWFIRIERYFTLKIVMHRLSDTAPTYLLKMPAIPWTCVLVSKKAISVLRKQ
jgi:hypothetical protein